MDARSRWMSNQQNKDGRWQQNEANGKQMRGKGVTRKVCVQVSESVSQAGAAAAPVPSAITAGSCERKDPPHRAAATKPVHSKRRKGKKLPFDPHE